jgi:hypothetical protein
VLPGAFTVSFFPRLLSSSAIAGRSFLFFSFSARYPLPILNSSLIVLDSNITRFLTNNYTFTSPHPCPRSTQYIPQMLASYDWRQRHAALMAIGAIAEGTGKVMVAELGKVVDLVCPRFGDVHPRVRYAACQCV